MQTRRGERERGSWTVLRGETEATCQRNVSLTPCTLLLTPPPPSRWEKYYLEIISEAGALAAPGEFDDTVDPLVIEKDVCWRILERSCSTNEQIDRLFLTQPLAADEQVGERKLSMGEEVVMRLALASDDVKHPAVDRIKPKPGSKPEPALSMSRDDVDDDSSALYNSPSLTKILGFLRPQKPLTPRRFGQLREKLGNRQLRDRERAARIANDKKKC